MLPILRIIPVGGVLLAILLLVLALSPPDGSLAPLTPGTSPMRGAMLARSEHPEWRQFIILAAIRRADELNRLRELPDTPTITLPAEPPAPPVPKVASLPIERSASDPDPDDATGSIPQTPAATIPIDIGETSAFELPVVAPEEQPPVIRTPQRVKSRDESRVKDAPRIRRAKTPVKPEQPGSVNLFETLLGPQKAKRPAAGGADNR